MVTPPGMQKLYHGTTLAQCQEILQWGFFVGMYATKAPCHRQLASGDAAFHRALCADRIAATNRSLTEVSRSNESC